MKENDQRHQRQAREIEIDVSGADVSAPQKPTKTFAVVSKQERNPFFDYVEIGCNYQAKALTTDQEEVICDYIGPVDPNPEEQIAVIEEVLRRVPPVDGLAVSVINAERVTPTLKKAREMGIPVVTFDSDSLPEGRLAYIGTDNWAMGQMLAKILQQLHPQGGVYGLVSDVAPNLAEREQGVRDHMAQYEQWIESPASPRYTSDSIDISLDIMEDYATLQNEEGGGMNAILPVGGWPLFDSNQTRYRNFVDANPNITVVSGDTLPVQVDILMSGYVDGLVGQVPREMGVESINSLYAISNGQPVESAITLTFLMEMVRIPLVLPELELDENKIGDLRWIGLTLCLVIFLTSAIFIAWTYTKRNVRIVKASQPLFLIMIALGAGILGSALIPLSFDDTKEEYNGDPLCMAVPWLSFMGFSISLSALFTKTWRINRIFHEKNAAHSRVTVKETDVLLPFAVLVGANAIILATWNILNPLVYVREAHEGTDVWNRVISYYGACRTEESSAAPYLTCLGLVNLGVLIIANWAAYESRSIQSEFAESKYIAISMICMLQAGLTGLPILYIVREIPEAFYLILVFMIFITAMAILLLIFVPKMLFEVKFAQQTPAQQNARIQEAVKRSTHKGLGGLGTHSGHRRNSSASQSSSVTGRHFLPSITPSGMAKISGASHSSLGSINEIGSDSEDDNDSRPSFAGDGSKPFDVLASNDNKDALQVGLVKPPTIVQLGDDSSIEETKETTNDTKGSKSQGELEPTEGISTGDDLTVEVGKA